MPGEKKFIRLYLGSQLTRKINQKSKNELNQNKAIKKEFENMLTHLQCIHTVGDNLEYGPGLDMSLQRGGEEIQIKPKNHKDPVSLEKYTENSTKDGIPAGDAAKVEFRKKLLTELSSNAAVSNLLLKFLDANEYAVLNTLGLYIGDKGLMAQNGSRSIVIEQGDNDDIIITNTMSTGIVSTGIAEVLIKSSPEIHKATVVVHIYPLKVPSGHQHQAIMVIESVQETINFTALDEQKKQHDAKLNGKEECQATTQVTQTQQAVNKNSKVEKHKAKCEHARNVLEQYATTQMPDDKSYLKDIKQLFNFFGFNKDAFMSAIMVFAQMAPEEVKVIFAANFSSLQLIQIARKLDDLKNNDNKAAVETTKSRIKEILTDKKHHVAIFRENEPVGLNEEEAKPLNILITNIKRIIEASSFYGKFSNLTSEGIKPFITLGEYLNIDPKKMKWYPIIKNIFSNFLYFSTTELCQINKDILKILQLSNSTRDTQLKLVKDMLVEILRERGVAETYYTIPTNVEIQIKAIKSALNSFFGTNTKKLIAHACILGKINNKKEIKEVLSKSFSEKDLIKISECLVGSIGSNRSDSVSLFILHELIKEIKSQSTAPKVDAKEIHTLTLSH